MSKWNFYNTLHQKICIYMPFIDTNNHLTTEPYNFEIKCHCNSESYDWYGFFGTKCRAHNLFFLCGNVFFPKERVLLGWLAGPSPTNKRKNVVEAVQPAPISNKENINIKGVDWKINKNLKCHSSNIVYAICCKKDQSKEVYIGDTKRMFKFWNYDQCCYVNNYVKNPRGSHFNQPGHCLPDLSFTIKEQVKKIY